MAAAFGFAGLVFALVVVDRNGAQVGLLLSVPVVGLSFGAAMADFAMGAALGLGSLFAQPVGHLSLVHYGLPPTPDAGAAPAWLFVVLLAAPAAASPSSSGANWNGSSPLRNRTPWGGRRHSSGFAAAGLAPGTRRPHRRGRRHRPPG